MIIPINDKYRISSDKNQWMIQQFRGLATKDAKGLKKGDEIWKAFSYHTTMNSTVRRLAELQIMESDADTLAEALNVLQRVAGDISRAFDLVAEVNWHYDPDPNPF